MLHNYIYYKSLKIFKFFQIRLKMIILLFWILPDSGERISESGRMEIGTQQDIKYN